MNKHILYLLAGLLLAPTPSWALTVGTPSGTIANGYTITIPVTDAGSGPTVRVFDDFESGTSGSQISTTAKYGTWTSTPPQATYSTTNKLSGSKSARFDITSTNSGTSLIKTYPAETDGLFYSVNRLIPTGTNWPGSGSSSAINWKTVWSFGDGASGPAANYTVDDDFFAPVVQGLAYETVLHDGYMSGNSTTSQISKGWIGSSHWGEIGTWKRQSVYIKGSTTNTGGWKLWSQTSTGISYKENMGFQTLLPTTGYWVKTYFNGYGRVTSNCYPTWDDLYLATGPNAQARVEIGNNSNYLSCSKMTILTPTSWGATSIQAIVNPGPFVNGESAYLFVTKADGTVNTGIPITFSGTTPVVNGLCGDESATVNIRPEATCVTGTPSATTENINTTTWTCVGSGGGTTDSCSAPFSTVSGDPATFALGGTAYIKTEGETFSVPVYRTGNTTGAGSVTYRTVGVTASGTLDYSGTNSGTVYFADGETSTAITVATWKDFLLENTETFTLEITGTSGTTGTPSSATMSILDGNEPVVKPRGLVLPLGQGTIWRAYPTGESIRVTQ